MKEHIVGVKINTRAGGPSKKTYYYRTDKDLQPGETIRVKVPSGGNPESLVVVKNSTKKFTRPVKRLEEKK